MTNHKNPAAVWLGSIRSAKKAATSAANGKLGGRPAGAWYDYVTGERIAARLPGLRPRDSIDQAKSDGGAGVVSTADGRRVYWL